MKKAYIARLIISGIIGILAILAICGIFYPVKILDLQFSALFQRILINFSLAAFILFAALIVITLLFGRLYCSLLCPFGILQEFANLIFNKLRKKSSKSVNPGKNLPVKYFIAALTIGALVGGSAVLIKYIDPYAMFGSMISISVTGLIFTFAVLVLVFFQNRYFCTNICPVGAILGLVSKLSLNKIQIKEDICVSCGHCAKTCPAACINYKEKFIDNEICIKCLKCLTICPKDAIKFGPVPKRKIIFSPKRREILIASSVLILFGGAIKTGMELSKNFARKIRNIILPPGAVNTNHMANKCLNCNLCIKNCPNGILVKGNEAFSCIHIDYSKGKRYCKYSCNKCSEVCPAGAIKRINVNTKQKTRIAMAMISEDSCEKCENCISTCPADAILKINDKITINGSKCIGCGKCATVCKTKSIEVFAVNEQKII